MKWIIVKARESSPSNGEAWFGAKEGDAMSLVCATMSCCRLVERLIRTFTVNN